MVWGFEFLYFNGFMKKVKKSKLAATFDLCWFLNSLKKICENLKITQGTYKPNLGTFAPVVLSRSYINLISRTVITGEPPLKKAYRKISTHFLHFSLLKEIYVNNENIFVSPVPCFKSR